MSRSRIQSHFKNIGKTNDGKLLFIYKENTRFAVVIEWNKHPETAEDLYELGVSLSYSLPWHTKNDIVQLDKRVPEVALREYTDNPNKWVEKRFNEYMDELDILGDLVKIKSLKSGKLVPEDISTEQAIAQYKKKILFLAGLYNPEQGAVPARPDSVFEQIHAKILAKYHVKTTRAAESNIKTRLEKLEKCLHKTLTEKEVIETVFPYYCDQFAETRVGMLFSIREADEEPQEEKSAFYSGNSLSVTLFSDHDRVPKPDAVESDSKNRQTP